jgi:hypothetical protein
LNSPSLVKKVSKVIVTISSVRSRHDWSSPVV